MNMCHNYTVAAQLGKNSHMSDYTLYINQHIGTTKLPLNNFKRRYTCFVNLHEIRDWNSGVKFQ